nr:MAG TPA: RNA polymerase I-like protein [Caudoviricetes sp.]
MTTEEKQKARMRVANIIKRSNIKRKCMLCGNEEGKVTVVHNTEDPYKIWFLCDSCRVGKTYNIDKVKKLKPLNVLDNLAPGKYVSSKFLPDEFIETLLTEFFKSKITWTKYLKENKISHIKASALLERYATKHPKEDITKKIQEHSQQYYSGNRLCKKNVTKM